MAESNHLNETVKTKHFYIFLRKQIILMISLSLGPGIAYIILGMLNGAGIRAIIWYLLLLLASLWGYKLYRSFEIKTMSRHKLQKWYRQTSYFYYCIFFLWTVVFLLYIPLVKSNMHYIAIFTQIGASVVASTLLFSDKRLFTPIILLLIIPLIIFFSLIGTLYGYVLTIFGVIFAWVLYYASTSSYNLLQKTNYQAAHDQLTGLYNRTYFVDEIQQLINTLKDNEGYCCLLLIDLDHFKTINDSLGHDVGDILLKEVAHRIKSIVPDDAVVARMGGDEFIVVGAISHSENTCSTDSMKLAENLRESLKETYHIGRHELYISASVGISELHMPNDNANQYIKEADIAMYEVKDKGRDGIVIFGKEISDRVERNLEIERRLHNALMNNELFINFQPQFNKARQIKGCEVLLRWENTELGNVSPAEFIPIAEKTGLIIEIGNYVIAESFKTFTQWHASGVELTRLSINVSMRQFFHHSFMNDIEHLSEKYLTESLRKNIVLELTESVMAEELEKLKNILEHLKSKGFSFSIDDFGTGYSSLSYLREVPVDEIKIDRTFIERLTDSDSDRSMIDMIMNLSDIFDLIVVAEGIETREQEEILVQSNCDLLQGFYLSRPISQQDFETLFMEQSLQ